MKETRSSTVARYELLRRALKGEKNISPLLFKACKTQGQLAKLSVPSAGIFPMSLNTLKTVANIAVENGGWAQLDNMRIAYLKIFDVDGKIPTTKYKTKEEQYRAQKSELTTALETERRYRIRLQVAYEELLNQLNKLARKDPDLANFLNRHIIGYSFKRLSLARENDSEE